MINLRALSREMILDYLGGLHVITRALRRGREYGQGPRMPRDEKSRSERGRQPLAVGKGKGTDSLLESPPADTFWTSDLQNCEIINLCCLNR